MKSASRTIVAAAAVAGIAVGTRLVTATPPPPADEVAPALVVAPVDLSTPSASPSAPTSQATDPGETATSGTADPSADDVPTTSPAALPAASSTTSPSGGNGHDDGHVTTVPAPPIASLGDDEEHRPGASPTWTPGWRSR